jgi:hypothetical protein
VGFEGCPQQTLVLLEHLAVALAKLLDEPRGSFDIGKEEGDYAARQICHAAQA